MTAAAPSDYINRFRPSQAEIDRRYANARKAMTEHGIDYLVVSGSEYSGFEARSVTCRPTITTLPT
jgi:hypothetical protein